ncbi:MAG: DNA polymerase III subunit delta [Candidatus Moranbacteria bacterium]|nr:DNA polymerase III subunit delta [Candidatus Moranbacteria bacterium]
MLYLYYGVGEHQILNRKKQIRLKLQEKKQVLVELSDFTDFKLDKLADLLGGGGLFSKQSNVFMSDFAGQTNKEQQEKLLNLLKNNNLYKDQDNVLYFFEPKIDKRTQFYKYLQRNASYKQDFTRLDGANLINYIGGLAKEKNILVSRDVLQRLVQDYFQDPFMIMNALDKLKNYKQGKRIQIQDLEQITDAQIINDIFKTIEALGRGDRKAALKLLGNHLETGENHYYLLSMIAYGYRTLTKIKSAQGAAANSIDSIVKQTKLNRFVVAKNLSYANRYTLESLKRIMVKISQIDYSIKTGQSNPENALYLLAAFS